MPDTETGYQLSGQQLLEQSDNFSGIAPVIIADNLKNPANVGGLFRLADAAGVSKIIFVQETPAPFESNKVVKRVSRHTTGRIQTEYMTSEELLSARESLPEFIAVELTSQAKVLFDTRLPSPCCLVIGAEKEGISEPLLACCKFAVKIPMLGQNGSMNVTHALAISLYEWHRQHSFKQN